MNSTTVTRAATSLQDKYAQAQGWVYLTGMQALVRLPLQQRLRDQAAGLNTGGYISGYRGSPMGRYDMELWAAEQALNAANIVFRAGLNEDLAAAAIWGSQYVGSFPGATVDGVFGIWYGKGPGVDRSGDALRHANLAGTSPKGGVLCLAGDDHGAKSSTVANFSDGIFMAVGMPLLYPASTQELLDYGLHGIAMSRFSGCWVGMKVVTDVAEGGSSVFVSPEAPLISLPEPPSQPRDNFGTGYHVRGFDMPLAQEDRLYSHKHAAVLAYARANGLNRITNEVDDARIGIVSAGKSWQDVQQALDTLGLDEPRLSELGVRCLKVGLIWPLDPGIVREFARGLTTIVVVEEKRPVLEDQLRATLYGEANAPRLIGKHMAGGVFDPERGEVAFPNAAELTPLLIAKVLANVLRQAHPELSACPVASPPASPSSLPAAAVRSPSFCSGCPHGRSTQVPEGSRALAGIGCHTMAMLIDPKRTTTVSHMGAEGVMWLGQQPFTQEKHVFANLGDGTYAHSGFLAVRQAIAAHVPITYKLLYNGFVSMTGGQAVETGQTPAQILAGLAAEGVRKMAVVTDEPERYDAAALPAGTTVHHRTQLEAVQKEFREHPDVSVILYDQACATERRRLRKRGRLPDPDKRVFINPAVCEGCGDCSKVSSCMSIEPLETELGRKRRINQASCNKDYSCVEGFCPSFVTVHGAKPKRAGGALPASPQRPSWNQALPEPVIAPLARRHAVLIAGIGGTGVVTIGQTLAVAAHVQGLFSSNLDITGLAQKYGAVHSHVQIAPRPELLHATRIAPQSAHTMIGCDLVVASGDESLSRLRSGTSRAVVSGDLIPTADFARNPDAQQDDAAMTTRLRSALGDGLTLLDGHRLATALMGDPVAANMFMLGVAWQLGMVPIGLAALERAIELNGVAVAMNKEALLWGRRAAHDLRAVEAIASARAPLPVVAFHPRQIRGLNQILGHRSKHLLAHTGPGLAQRYRALVDRVIAGEAVVGQRDELARAVAHNYHRLLAVKDEWEVARLYSAPEFKAAIEQEFEGDFTLSFHVGAWPFAKTDAASCKLIKAELGPWLLTAFKWMARLKGLRGSWLDPFRNNAERALDRRLLAQYEADIGTILQALTPENHAAAVKLASLPTQIRGYGHVREAQAASVASVRSKLLSELRLDTHQAAVPVL